MRGCGTPPGRSMTARALADERASVTLWMIGLSVMMLGLGALSIDLWHLMAERRALVGIADAAAYAASSGLDETAVRREGRPRLAPGRAKALAAAVVAARPDAPTPIVWRARVAPDGRSVTVSVQGRVDTLVLGLLVPGAEELPIRVTARAGPRRG